MTADTKKLRQARRALETAGGRILQVRAKYTLCPAADKLLADIQEDVVLALEATAPMNNAKQQCSRKKNIVD
jgi:hypothetical protein